MLSYSLDPKLLNQLIDLFAAFILVSSFLVLAIKRLYVHVRLYATQSFFLALVAFLVAAFGGEPHIFIAAALTFIFKVMLIPFLFRRIINRLNVQQEAQLTLNVPASLIVAAGLVLGADYLTRTILETNQTFELSRNVLTVSLSVVLMGLFTMVTRKKALTQVIGFLTIENGLFLAGIAITAGMPMIVELGVLFDVLVAVFIMGVLLYRINETFDTINVEKLTKLKG
ncbi:hydrogenase [Candidatus Acetothermia bacterium]|nr:hydrogenase [Candidatus Acetothermia bacterium]MBI3661015.1 hydrogenase [Candidatus Acetothermia bacterium]